jgi:stearoyl-CoA desaturase (delta-9 desaturase)
MQAADTTDGQRMGLLGWGAIAVFVAVHLGTLFAFQVGASVGLVGAAVALYVVRMWAVTAGYHRYFSHRAYKTSRPFQFALAFLAQTSLQKGALWWAANHRHHHKFSDQPEDLHSPVQRGFWWSHVGWILSPRYDATDLVAVKDLARYPELVWLNRWHWAPAVLFGAALALVGGWPLFVWGFLVSTTVLWHGTFVINSLTHVFGSRRYQTSDDSRNNLLFALITLGEGWHNNHHHYQSSANQGFFWWEVDLTYYVLRALAAVGLVRDLRRPPEHARLAHLVVSQPTPLRTPKTARLEAEAA